MILTFDILNTMFSHNIIMFTMFPFIFIYNTKDTGEYFQNNNEQYNDVELIQIAHIENKQFYPKFHKHTLSDFELKSNTGIILLDEPIDLNIKLKNKNICKYISSQESFINNINKYLDITLEGFSDNLSPYYVQLYKDSSCTAGKEVTDGLSEAIDPSLNTATVENAANSGAR